MRKAILFCLLCLFICGTCFAEKQEWIDKNYKFSNITKVFIYEPVIPDNIKNGINEKEIIESFNAKTNINNVKLVYLPEVIESLKQDMNIDIMILNRSNPQEASIVLNSNISKYADIIICSNINFYGIVSRYTEPIYYQLNNQMQSLPGGNFPVACVGVKWEVYDAYSLKPIITRIESRDRMNRLSYENTKPKDLYERITESFFTDINKKISKK